MNYSSFAPTSISSKIRSEVLISSIVPIYNEMSGRMAESHDFFFFFLKDPILGKMSYMEILHCIYLCLYFLLVVLSANVLIFLAVILSCGMFSCAATFIVNFSGRGKWCFLFNFNWVKIRFVLSRWSSRIMFKIVFLFT